MTPRANLYRPHPWHGLDPGRDAHALEVIVASMRDYDEAYGDLGRV